MTDPSLPPQPIPPSRSAAVLPIAVAFAILASLGALAWAYTLQSRLSAAENRLQATQQGNSALIRQIAEAEVRIRTNSANVDQQLTQAQLQQQELVSRAQAIAARQQADTSRLERTQRVTEQKVGAVATDVSSVKTDVGSVKTDVSATKTDLADTKTILQRTIGDAGVMSGLIAHNHDELETLKHRGDRSYYEFTLQKNATPLLLATIKLQLKKVNEKKSRFNLIVSSDDRNIEKKDRTVYEPVQFYTGKNPVLYEIVVNNIGHDTISGYLSTPKGM